MAGVSALVARQRSTTGHHLRTEAKQRVRAMREQLDPDDQMLLLLRVDKGMCFRELALVMDDERLQHDRVDAEAARLRKRFERIKTELRAIARAEGLLSDESSD
jgi:RNA polymerase sigma-70 factor (ECF subfamily)